MGAFFSLWLQAAIGFHSFVYDACKCIKLNLQTFKALLYYPASSLHYFLFRLYCYNVLMLFKSTLLREFCVEFPHNDEMFTVIFHV